MICQNKFKIFKIIPAKSSIADNCLTTAPSRDSDFDPTARVVVVTNSTAIGTDATIRTTTKDNALLDIIQKQ